MVMMTTAAARRSLSQRVAVAWQNSSKRRYSNTLIEKHGSTGCQILMSPPLVHLDLPDVWTPTPNHCDPPSASASTSVPDCSNGETAAIIDGKSMAEDIRSRIASEVRRMKESIGKIPGLAVVLVGQRRDSQTYVRNKIKACEEAGIKSLMTELPHDCTEDEVLNSLLNFNEDPTVHGVLVQLPLPKHLDERKILNMLCLEKDVDGFHPLNMGSLAMRGREPLFIPCTPKGCIELLIRSGVEIMGKNAVVVGRSNTVGLPTSLLLQRHHATISIVHAFTENPELLTSQADIVVTAAGVPNLVRGNWLKRGAVVIDVGTFPIEDSSCDHGYRLQGDVCYEEAIDVVSAITPVPGGVGPMTIAMLLSNTLDSAKRAYDFT
ncbi:THF_DHG_CYH domain-containing protein/THF_DHG_CYH_C domain-containing protein [Cephalotus follicularis]|uniref:THF_DHG_CYH domain-containing protein/THF_DHG_CYH_C domain-containing protein n=1 Tax=Cephalotus follicularis TaxID=3775 RepID=A0A1Q3CB89_CEPFO|nr:THF_DHG_CYH domain-containing protein/THF_DHG_CYH_C domain-containing protein [Cephalotus follicularis]